VPQRALRQGRQRHLWTGARPLEDVESKVEDGTLYVHLVEA